MKVSEVGEFGIIERLASALGTQPPPQLVVGIGDDCAVWQLGNEQILATTDTLVEGVHFLTQRAPWTEVGWKALAVSVSDVASMGGEPLFALVTLALPDTTDIGAVDAIYEGLRRCAAEYGVAVAGGDIVRAPELSVTVALIGRAQMRDGATQLMRRDAARVGDVIAVTGTLGDSAAGLRRLMAGVAPEDPLVMTHLHPRPPIAIAQEATRVGVHCAIDVSDGLLQDIAHVCEMSRVGAALHAGDIPISAAVRKAYPEEGLALACSGGEDYQVVLVGASGVMAALAELHPGEVSLIGRITDAPVGAVRVLDRTGTEITVPSAGWDHLRAGGSSSP